VGTRKTTQPRSLSEEQLLKMLAEWDSLPVSQHRKIFTKLDRHSAEELFFKVSAHDQAELFNGLPEFDRKSWIRLLPPDDAADLIQELPVSDRAHALELLDHTTRMEVLGLLAYKEDEAGGLMNPRYARLRPDMTVDEALRYLREQTRSQVETIYYAYVLDSAQRLLGAISLREIFSAPHDKKVSEIMATGDQITFVRENQSQEEIARLFSQKEHRALPVLDEEGRMKGIITVDDVVDILREEATEDIQKIGGMEAMYDPYFKTSLFEMIKKRVGWLLILFLGEMFTANAMGYYADEIAKVVVLALFVPLIVSSGGNSGSQATTLIIRAMALGEVRLQDWWRVFFREAASGVVLGIVLGTFGILRIVLWPNREALYGAHYPLIAVAVGFSVAGIVMWGTLVGSMLPLVLRRLGFDPAAASAPFVATLVDVTGLVIYFTMANIFLRGTVF
jgi:magnesium transporter